MKNRISEEKLQEVKGRILAHKKSLCAEFEEVFITQVKCKNGEPGSLIGVCFFKKMLNLSPGDIIALYFNINIFNDNSNPDALAGMAIGLFLNGVQESERQTL